MMPLILTLSVLAGGDAATTCIGLASGYVEANSLFGRNPTCTRVVLIKAAGTGGTIYSAAVLHKRGHPRWAKVMLWTTIGANVAVVGWNSYQLSRRK